MEVIVIEIKGANFSFSNSSSYRNMSFKINEAAQQVRGKLNFIQKNYNEFRAFVHKVREQVELGRNIYNSLLGPNGYLHVDPNKDICVSGVLIGGDRHIKICILTSFWAGLIGMNEVGRTKTVCSNGRAAACSFALVL